MNDLELGKTLAFKANEEDCKKLIEIMEGVTELYNKNPRSDKDYVMNYMKFKELVRYFVTKCGSKRTCTVTQVKNPTSFTYSLTVYTPQGLPINSAIFVDG